jgi:hypothetical protein
MGLLQSLFGGSNSSSGNSSYGDLKSALLPGVQQGGNMFHQLGDALSGGFDAFKKNAGFDFQLNRGNHAITGGAAAHGLLNSGSTQKGLATFETGLGNSMYNNWLDRLGQGATIGNQQAGILAGAGQTSKESKSNGILSSLFG